MQMPRMHKRLQTGILLALCDLPAVTASGASGVTRSSQLTNLDHLILGDVGEVLARVADRPEHLEVHDARRLAEADVLLQR